MFIGHPAETAAVHRHHRHHQQNNDIVSGDIDEEDAALDIAEDDVIVTQVLAAGRRVDDGIERWLPAASSSTMSAYGDHDSKPYTSAGHPAAAAAGLLDITDGLSSLSSSATSCPSMLLSSSPAGSSISQTDVNKQDHHHQQHTGKRKRENSYARPCAFLQPGMIFCGKQSFTAYPSSPYYRVAGDRLPQHHSHSHLHSHGHHHHHPHHAHTHARQHEQRRQAPTWADAYFSRHNRSATASSQLPSTLRTTDLRPVAAYSRELPSWETLNQPSAIDPQLQAMLAAAPSYYVPDRSHLPAPARIAECTRGLSHTEEWEVKVSS